MDQNLCFITLPKLHVTKLQLPSTFVCLCHAHTIIFSTSSENAGQILVTMII